MADPNRRKYARKDTLNLVDYLVLGEGGVSISRGMGRTRNVSEGGLLLETHRPLELGQTVVITLSLREDMVKLKGRVQHLLPPSEDKRYCAGIQLFEMNERDRRILKSYIEALRTPSGA